MNIGEQYQHKYSPQYTCVITAITHKGAKVAQTEHHIRCKDKTITAYYDSRDFIQDARGFWVIQTPAMDLDIQIPVMTTPAHKPQTKVENQLIFEL